MNSENRKPVVPSATSSESVIVRPTRNLDDVLAFQLRRAQEASHAAFARRVGDSSIWPGWYALLVIIRDNPGINQTDLSKASNRDKSTLTASLRELSKAGLLERVRDGSDRRSFRLSLSASGVAYLAELEVHALAHDRQIDSIVGQDKREELVRLLETLAKALNSGNAD